ncbi:molybdopterin-dependent oxidoreductase [Neobacillus sp. 19]|uniref:molybdopterin-dependent oxidoreductase n=1 Tax=Neobacillus sp. 19 TaxID=3394458 RepID=UPI003BF74F65
MKDGIYRNTCPRNCYGTCGILSHVKNGRLIKVTGDPKHGFTKGRLCAKGYASTQFIYNTQRLKYPMIQSPRGSGNWKRISWDEAYSIIARKIIELNQRYGSNLASGYNKFSGNLGFLHYAVEGMFNSLGPHTKPTGNPCALTGKLAVNHSIGENYSSVPEDMAHASLIVIWGANPAVTNVHQMKFIYEARRSGAKFVVIDPIFTRTAEKADIYIQIKPGTDGWLALGIAKIIIEKGINDEETIRKQTNGWDQYKNFIQHQLDLSDVLERTGVPMEAMEALAELYTHSKPAVTWNGLGLQRNDKGGHSISAITSLAAMTNNLRSPNGGLYYMHFDIDHFPQRLVNHQGPVHPTIADSREVDISNFSKNALALNDPPLKFLWVASRNIITQDQNLNTWQQLFNQLELIVTVDLYLTKTAKQSDIVLPAASHFEEEDLNVGYWHYWLALNQKAIPPYYEAKSDLQIARELTKKLNDLSPEFSNFPFEKEPIDWIKEELSPEIMQQYGLTSYEDLLEGPQQKIEINDFQPNPEKFKLLPAIEAQFQADDPQEPLTYRLLSPQSLLKIHSQYESVSWLDHRETDNIIEISTSAANEHGMEDHTNIEIYNEHGSISGALKINPTLPANVVLSSQAGSNPINQLISQKEDKDASGSSTFFYDSKVKIRKRRDTHV